MMKHKLLEINDLSVSADEKEILKNLSLSIGAGETHILMGPNGAGKSTLGYALMGSPQYKVTAGKILLEGNDITGLATDARARAGMFLSFQAPVEVPGVTLYNFLRMVADCRTGKKLVSREFRKEITEILALLEMDESYIHRELNVGFSGGEKKKIEMLQLLLADPKVAILDETDSGLDVDAIQTVARGIEKFRSQRDKGLLIITHNTRILEHIPVDYVHVLVKGQLVSSGDASLLEAIDQNGFEQFEKGGDIL